MNYNKIIVGFAPGGMVVVWVFGAGSQVEIGRYQGKKVVISQQEISGLDYHERLLFDPAYRKRTMLNEKIVPKEVQESNKNKPIPYGLWDTYREKYIWRPIFKFQNEEKEDGVNLFMYNGEFDKLVFDKLKKNEFTNRSIPKKINFGFWSKEDQAYAGDIDFKEEEIFKAFAEIYKDNREGEVEFEIRLNKLNTYLTVKLKGNGKEIALKESKIDIFKSRVKRAKENE